tara:strand:- start:1 stop:234 length:234 start_codon:yes stop_codon:yes gene_type:complete
MDEMSFNCKRYVCQVLRTRARTGEDYTSYYTITRCLFGKMLSLSLLAKNSVNRKKNVILPGIIIIFISLLEDLLQQY